MKTIGWLASWAMYWLGDFFSKVLEIAPDTEGWQGWAEFWYGPYNWCMVKSSHIQYVTGCDGPWEE